MATKKLTLEQLIAAKSKRDKFAIKDVFIKSLDGRVTVQKIPYDAVLNAMDLITKESTMTNVLEVYKELIYKSVPMFQHGDLLKAYEVVEPFDIVTELLELGEIMEVGGEILSLYGFDTLEDEIKN